MATSASIAIRSAVSIPPCTCQFCLTWPTEPEETWARYMASREWQVRKAAVLIRHNGLCAHCLVARSTQVHHITYLRRFHERDEDLEALCRKCHEWKSGRAHVDPSEANGAPNRRAETLPHQGGLSKIERYGWKLENKPGVLQYTEKSELRVDHAYQRPLNDAKRLRIAANFNWIAFGALIVARRPNQDLYVIEGQHRLAAVMSRADIQSIPCVIFNVEAIDEEAKNFLTTNRERQALRGTETFAALLASGNTTSQLVQELVTASGRIVSGVSSANGVACVASMVKCANKDEQALRVIWPVVVEVSRGQTLDMRLLIALFETERRLTREDGAKQSIAASPWREKLLEAGFRAIMQAIGDAGAHYHRGGETVWARGVLTLLNYKLRNRLVLAGLKE